MAKARTNGNGKRKMAPKKTKKNKRSMTTKRKMSR